MLIIGASGCGPASTEAAQKSDKTPKAPLILHRKAANPAEKITSSRAASTPKTASAPSSTSRHQTVSGSNQTLRTADGQKLNPSDIKEPGTIRDLIRLFKSERLSITDVTADMTPPYQKAFIEAVKPLGGSEQAVLRLDQNCKFITVRFKDREALAALLNSPPDLLLFRNFVMTPTSQPSEDWELICRVVERLGGRRVFSAAPQASTVLSQLQVIRAQIKQFKLKTGSHPNFAASQWEQMLKGRYLPAVPVNPFSPRGYGDKIEVLNTVGSTGELVAFNKAGWVWNNADGSFFPAGITEQKLQLALRGGPGGKYHIALPEEHVSIRLAYLRKALESIMSAQQSAKKPNPPSLSELQAAVAQAGPPPNNPFTRSSLIQKATWDAKKPPVNGGAGWNYDERTGKIWPNSSVAGENKF
ncbi:MAG: hypothetical protein L0Y44_04625 [Phycisphaerales bacterium]|nr:hypothetical protein [Phycisphaerales bacterium]